MSRLGDNKDKLFNLFVKGHKSIVDELTIPARLKWIYLITGLCLAVNFMFYYFRLWCVYIIYPGTTWIGVLLFVIGSWDTSNWGRIKFAIYFAVSAGVHIYGRLEKLAQI